MCQVPTANIFFVYYPAIAALASPFCINVFPSIYLNHLKWKRFLICTRLPWTGIAGQRLPLLRTGFVEYQEVSVSFFVDIREN